MYLEFKSRVWAHIISVVEEASESEVWMDQKISGQQNSRLCCVLGLLRKEVRPQGSENIPKYKMLKSSLSMATEGIGKGTGIRKRKPDKLDAKNFPKGR